jgi:hypothetical protein
VRIVINILDNEVSFGLALEAALVWNAKKNTIHLIYPSP